MASTDTGTEFAPTIHSPMSRNPFVGRSGELAELSSLLNSRTAGAGMVVITGEPGIGKTRLLAEFERRHQSVLFLVGRGSPMSAALPFSTLVEALESHLRRLPPSTVLELAGTRAPTLTTVLPSLAFARPMRDAEHPARLEVFEALSQLLAAMSSKQRVVLFLDDVHQADPSTWDAVSYLGRNSPPGQLLTVLTVRPAELRALSQLEMTIGLLLKDGLASEIRLGALDKVALAKLVEAILAEPDDELTRWLELRTRGNPLYALALLEDLKSHRDQRVVPASVKERVRLAVAALPASARELLELLSAFGHAFATSWLLQLKPDCGSDFDLLVEQGLVTESTRGDASLHDFEHPLVQEAVYSLIGPAHQRQLHATIAKAGGIELPLRAYHAARGALVGETWAVDLLRSAAREAEESQAHREALEHLIRTLELLSEDQVQQRREVLDEIAWQASSCGDHVAGIRALTELARLLPKEPELQARNHIRLASFLSTGTGDLEAAAAHAATAVGLLAGSSSGALALAINELAWVRGEAGDIPSQVELSRRAVQIAVEAQDSRAEMHALGALGHGLGMAGSTQEAVEVLRRSLRLAYESGDRAQIGWHTGALADALLTGGRVEDANKLLEDLLEVRGPSDVAYFTFARVNWFRGRWDAALTACLTVRSLNPNAPSIHSAWALSLAAHLLIAMNRVDEAHVLRAEAERVYRGRHFYCFSAWHDWATGLALWDLGELEEAKSRMESARLQLVTMGAHGAAGDISPDLDMITRTLGGVRETGSVEEALNEAVPYRRARALESLAPALPTPDRLLALEESARLYASLPAPRHQERVMHEIRLMGAAGVRAARRVGSLTERELAVARLTVRGLTAPEVGKSLHVSPRTVESHLAHAYAKLGISGRAQLAERLRELAG